MKNQNVGERTAACAQQEVGDFFEQNYKNLSRYCHSKWNGRGDDVLHSAFLIATQRYKKINFSLFAKLATEAARNICSGWTHDDEHTIILPPNANTAKRLSKALAVADSDDNFEIADDVVAFLRKDALFTRILRENREATQSEIAELRRRCETRPLQFTLF